MKTIAFVVPWMVLGGVMPNYFPLWLQSVGYNKSIDFLLFTDDRRKYDYPDNVKVFYMEFKELRILIQRKYEFPISLEKPYKLCDFRPAYGDIFSEYLEGYDFWGHCDVDLFWGDIRKFITEEILESYDRIYSKGHCSLYRNRDEINVWYKNLPACGYQNWKEVFRKPSSCCFDEWGGHCGGGISHIMTANGLEIYDEPDLADLNFAKGYFKVNRWQDCYDRNLYFLYRNGKLTVYSREMEKEILYCHFQKREIYIDGEIEKENFLFVSPGLVTSDMGKVRRYRVRESIFVLAYYFRKIRRKLKNER